MTQFQVAHTGYSEVQAMEGIAALLSQSPATPGVATTATLYGLGVAQQSTANGTVLVAVGAGVVQGSLTAGASLLINDAAFTLDIFTANPMGGLARNDIVVFDSLTRAIIAIIGAPNATPTDPTIPATSLPLARLRHAASDTTISTAQIDDLRTYTTLLNQPVPVPSLTARNALSPANGTRAMRLDLGGRVETYNAADTAWYPRTGANIAGAGWADNAGTPFNGTSYRRTADGLCQLSGLLLRTDPTFSTTSGTFYVIGFVPTWMAPTDCAKQFPVWTSLGVAGSVARVTTAGQVSFSVIGSSVSVVQNVFSVAVDGSWWR